MGDDVSPDVSSEGHNIKPIFCLWCPCKVLLPKMAKISSENIKLPPVTIKSGATYQRSDDQLIEKCWVVEGMYTFENVGFSNTVDGSTKYLICADCEKGPIGLQYISDGNKFMVAVNRVRYEI